MTTATPPANCSGWPVSRNCSSARFSISRVRSRRDRSARPASANANRYRMPTASTVAPRIRWPPPWRKESSSSSQLSAPGSAENTASGSTKTTNRTSRSPLPMLALAVAADRQYGEHERRQQPRPAKRRQAHAAASARGWPTEVGPPLGAGVDHIADDASLVAVDHAAAPTRSASPRAASARAPATAASCAWGCSSAPPPRRAGWRGGRPARRCRSPRRRAAPSRPARPR